MVAVISKEASRATWTSRSPSSQLAWTGSPRASWTELAATSPRSFSSSGMLFTFRDQLQTPISRFLMASRHVPLLWDYISADSMPAGRPAAMEGPAAIEAFAPPPSLLVLVAVLVMASVAGPTNLLVLGVDLS